MCGHGNGVVWIYCNNKLIKLLQQINDRFDINNKPWKFCLGIFFLKLSYWAVYSLFSTYKGNTKQLF